MMICVYGNILSGLGWKEIGDVWMSVCSLFLIDPFCLMLLNIRAAISKISSERIFAIKKELTELEATNRIKSPKL